MHLLPVDDVDFSKIGSYSSYNWELFFHTPLLIADRLSKNQRFEEAQKWFHYIFNPTDTSSSGEDVPQRYWITRQFYKTYESGYQAQQINAIMKSISDNDPEVIAQVDEWRANPFSPHLIARSRTVTLSKNDGNEISRQFNLLGRSTVQTRYYRINK